MYLIICKTYILSVAAAPLTSLVPEKNWKETLFLKKKKKKNELPTVQSSQDLLLNKESGKILLDNDLERQIVKNSN